MIEYYKRTGFAEFTTTIVIGALAVIMALSIILFVQMRKSKAKDETIRVMNSEKVLDDVVSDNTVHETKHRTIGESIPKRKVVHAEVNTSNGTHRIQFK